MAIMTVDTSKAQNLGDGIQAVEVEGKLVLVIDPTKDFGVSTSGKMRACANSGGFTSAPFGLKLNLYAGRKI
jgi:hypothetical protein